jgi:hypothetical protein
MRERGKYQIQCMKSRSSTGVGQKIDLDYNIETMRITDPGEEAGPVNSFAKGNLLDSIKAKSTMINGIELANSADHVDSNKITADVQSAKLKQLLGQIKQIVLINYLKMIRGTTLYKMIKNTLTQYMK